MKRIFSFVLVFILAFSLFGCAGEKNNSGKKNNFVKTKKSDEISIFSYKPDTLYPIASQNEANLQMLGIVFDSLITLPDNLYPEPCLAESWSVSEDGGKWEIALRRDVIWHDGESFTSEDVIYTVESIRKNKESVFSHNVANIKSIKAKGKFELEIEVAEPRANFINMMYFPIVKKASMDVGAENFRVVGTGAYKFEQRNEGNVFYLVKNKKWWGGEATTNCITVKLLPDNDTVLYAFSSGSIDLTMTDDMNWGRFVDPVSASYSYVPTPVFHFVGVNHENPALNFPEIRKAIALSIDRGKMIEEVMTGYATATTMPLHPNWFMCENIKFDVEQNPNRAKETLFDNGWELRDEVFEKTVEDEVFRADFKILYNEDNPRRESIAKMIKKNLEEFGIKVSVEKTSFENYQTYISEGNYDLFIGSYIVPPDADFSFIIDEQNVFNFSSAELNNAISNLKTKYSISGIEEGYMAVAEKLEQLNPVVGLFFENQIMVHSNSIRGEIKPSYFDVYKGIEFLQKENDG